MTAATTPARTQRVPDAWAGPGATHQHGGNLPVYRCNSCGAEVVWASSRTTDRRYLANVYQGLKHQRYYRGDVLHPRDCATRAATQVAEIDRRQAVLEIQRRQAAELFDLRRAGATDDQMLAVINRYDVELAPFTKETT